jgi:two-component system, cell cycle sensor histidine kinase and response regulator CckA
LRHNGGVGLASPPGEGATFFVYLPLHTLESVAIAVTPVSEPAGESRVLVVDDDPAVRQIVGKVIARHGCAVVMATDGQDGWEKFEQAETPFDVVLTDLTMPRLGGMQLGERIFNSGRKPAVLLMTAFAATLDPEQLRRAGFAALVPKPLDLEHLKQLLATVRTHR